MMKVFHWRNYVSYSLKKLVKRQREIAGNLLPIYRAKLFPYAERGGVNR
jgi:hypothetical protein